MIKKISVWLPVVGGFLWDLNGTSDGLKSETVILINAGYHIVSMVALIFLSLMT